MRSCKGGITILYRLFVVLVFIALPLLSSAQTGGGELGCSDSDPFQQPCPLDTWVIALVVAAGIFTALYLHRKQKSAQA